MCGLAALPCADEDAIGRCCPRDCELERPSPPATGSIPHGSAPRSDAGGTSGPMPCMPSRRARGPRDPSSLLPAAARAARGRLPCRTVLSTTRFSVARHHWQRAGGRPARGTLSAHGRMPRAISSKLATVAVQGRGSPAESLPALDDHVAVGRIELDQPRLPPGLLGRDQGRARAAERIQHDVAASCSSCGSPARPAPPASWSGAGRSWPACRRTRRRPGRGRRTSSGRCPSRQP